VVKTALKGRELDFLFIDGDHIYEAVKKDFEDWWPKLQIPGYMLFHDAARREDVNFDGWPGPIQLCNELEQKGFKLEDRVDTIKVFKKE
jgi:hypothetical protein